MPGKTIQTYEHLLDELRETQVDFCEGREEWEALRLFRDALVDLRREVSERLDEINEEREAE